MQIESKYNNESCSAIPSLLKGAEERENASYTARSRNWVVSDFYGVEDFHVEIDWKFGVNGMKLKRAHKSGGMNRCDFMTFYRNGIQLTGEHRRKCIEVIKTRIERNLGIDFTNGILFRSRFVIVCAYPFKLLQGLEIHHIVADNQTQRRHAESQGYILDESWCRGTDDRLSNLQVVTSNMHKLIHERQGDVWWFKSDKNYEPEVQEEVIDNPLPPANSGFQPSCNRGIEPTQHPLVDFYNCSPLGGEAGVEFFRNLAAELGVNLDSG